MSSSIFNAPIIHREHFDPTKEAHIKSMKYFIQTGNWGAVQFLPELPYIEVPMTVLMKFAEHMTNVKRESSAERGARIGSYPNVIQFTLDRLTPAQERMNRSAELVEINRAFFASRAAASANP